MSSDTRKSEGNMRDITFTISSKHKIVLYTSS